MTHFQLWSALVKTANAPEGESNCCSGMTATYVGLRPGSDTYSISKVGVKSVCARRAMIAIAIASAYWPARERAQLTHKMEELAKPSAMAMSTMAAATTM